MSWDAELIMVSVCSWNMELTAISVCSWNAELAEVRVCSLERRAGNGSRLQLEARSTFCIKTRPSSWNEIRVQGLVFSNF